MMGSPFYYDVPFDDGPGDVVFHDCMWSGICTCCIQLLHQDSFYYSYEPPDLKLSSTTSSAAAAAVASTAATTIAATSLPPSSSLSLPPSSICSPPSLSNSCSSSSSHSSACSPQSNSSSPESSSSSSSSTDGNQQHQHHTTTSLNSPHQDIKTPLSSNSISPDTASSLSNSTSPKPVRRREHNDSERKRRDHLRNAFNFLRDQVPRFKAINKKPPRIQILHEATLYVQRIINESKELERGLEAERAKHEKLQKL